MARTRQPRASSFKVIYRRTTRRKSAETGFVQLQSEGDAAQLFGFSSDGHVRLRDEQGKVWSGVVDRGEDNLLHYRLRNSEGRYLSGVGTAYLRVFRDDRGHVWRGVVD